MAEAEKVLVEIYGREFPARKRVKMNASTQRFKTINKTFGVDGTVYFRNSAVPSSATPEWLGVKPGETIQVEVVPDGAEPIGIESLLAAVPLKDGRSTVGGTPMSVAASPIPPPFVSAQAATPPPQQSPPAAAPGPGPASPGSEEKVLVEIYGREFPARKRVKMNAATQRFKTINKTLGVDGNVFYRNVPLPSSATPQSVGVGPGQTMQVEIVPDGAEPIGLETLLVSTRGSATPVSIAASPVPNMRRNSRTATPTEIPQQQQMMAPVVEQPRPGSRKMSPVQGHARNPTPPQQQQQPQQAALSVPAEAPRGQRAPTPETAPVAMHAVQKPRTVSPAEPAAQYAPAPQRATPRGATPTSKATSQREEVAQDAPAATASLKRPTPVRPGNSPTQSSQAALPTQQQQEAPRISSKDHTRNEGVGAANLYANGKKDEAPSHEGYVPNLKSVGPSRRTAAPARRPVLDTHHSSEVGIQPWPAIGTATNGLSHESQFAVQLEHHREQQRRAAGTLLGPIDGHAAMPSPPRAHAGVPVAAQHQATGGYPVQVDHRGPPPNRFAGYANASIDAVPAGSYNHDPRGSPYRYPQHPVVLVETTVQTEPVLPTGLSHFDASGAASSFGYQGNAAARPTPTTNGAAATAASNGQQANASNSTFFGSPSRGPAEYENLKTEVSILKQELAVERADREALARQLRETLHMLTNQVESNRANVAEESVARAHRELMQELREQRLHFSAAARSPGADGAVRGQSVDQIPGGLASPIPAGSAAMATPNANVPHVW